MKSLIAWIVRMLGGHEGRPGAGPARVGAGKVAATREHPAAVGCPGDWGGLADPRRLAADVDLDFYPWLAGLEAFVARPLHASEERVLESLEQMLSGERPSTELVPRLPMVIPQLMRSLRDQETTGAQLVRQIERDPVLVGEAIRMANSPYYRRSRPVSGIAQAVVRLGHDGLQQLVARVAFYPIFSLRSGHAGNLVGARIWSQSERCALACHCLARRKGEDVFAAYLAGLVSNVGLIVGFRVMDQVLKGQEDQIPDALEFYRVFIDLAQRFTRRILNEWDFPETIVRAAAEKSGNDSSGPRSQLGDILHVADCYGKLALLSEDRRIAQGPDVLVVAGDPCYRRLLPGDGDGQP